MVSLTSSPGHQDDMSISSFSVHFPLLSPVPPNFLIFSLFPLHFLILSPFPRSLAARPQQLVQPCLGPKIQVICYACHVDHMGHMGQKNPRLFFHACHTCHGDLRPFFSKNQNVCHAKNQTRPFLTPTKPEQMKLELSH